MFQGLFWAKLVGSIFDQVRVPQPDAKVNMNNTKFILSFILSLFISSMLNAQEQTFELLFPVDDETLNYKGDSVNGVRFRIFGLRPIAIAPISKLGPYENGVRQGSWIIYINKLERARLRYSGGRLEGAYVLFL